MTFVNISNPEICPVRNIAIFFFFCRAGFSFIKLLEKSNYINNLYTQYRKLEKEQKIAKKKIDSPHPRRPQLGMHTLGIFSK